MGCEKNQENFANKIVISKQRSKLLLYKNKNNKNLATRNIEGYYIPDDIEIVNQIDDEESVNESIAKAEATLKGIDVSIKNELDNDLFKTIDKFTHNTIGKTSTNQQIAMKYLSYLKKHIKEPTKRQSIIQDLLYGTQKANKHFSELTEKLFNCTEAIRYSLLAKFVEFPLECMSSYLQETTNNDSFLRRKYYDGQVRKRKDGSTYQRKCNIFTESDTITVGKDGKEYSPMKTIEQYDKYFDNINNILAVLNDDEKEVATLLYELSSNDKKATLAEITAHSKYSQRQIETLLMKIKCKTLKWLKDNELNENFNKYYNMCKKYKNFEKKYAKYTK